MFAYLARCFVILLGLWFARYFRFIPPTDLVTLLVIVVVPMLIAIGAWRAGRRSQKPPTEHVTADDALSAVESQLIRRL